MKKLMLLMIACATLMGAIVFYETAPVWMMALVITLVGAWTLWVNYEEAMKPQYAFPNSEEAARRAREGR